MALLGAVDGALLLRFTYEDDSFVRSKCCAALIGDIVFPLTLLKRDHGMLWSRT
jgi:hypothetical protein